MVHPGGVIVDVLELLLSPMFQVFAGLVFLAAGVVLFVKRKKLSGRQRLLLILCIVLCLLYFAFLFQLSIAFGSNTGPSRGNGV